MYKFLSAFIALFLISACTNKNPEVPLSAEGINPLLIGQQIPDVALQNAFNHDVDLNNIVSENISLIVFYRGGWCPYCNGQLSQLANIEDELKNRNVQIIGISTDKPEYIRESVTEQELGYMLLSDSSMEGAKQFGIAYKEDDQTVQSLKENGMDIVERSGYEHHLLPVPAIFLVDTDGMIHFQYTNPDYKVRASSEVILAAVNDLLEN